MKTAILISGHMRSFERCLPTLHWHVFRHFPDADFFVSTVADDDAPKAQLLRTRYPKARVEIECVPEQPDCIADLRAKGCQLPAEWFKGKPYMHEPYAISVHPQAVARQLWQLEQAWNLMLRSTIAENENVHCKYDVVIRCRPDLWFQSLELERSGVIHDNGAFGENVALTPGWGRFGGVNDRFAILGAKAAHAYFTTYSQIPALLAAGCPLHPESLVKAALLSGGAELAPVDALFETRRANGEHREVEILTADLLR